MHDRDAARAEALVAKLCGDFGAGRAAVAEPTRELLGSVDGVVNATPMGMASAPGAPLDTALLESRHWVADIVYFPLETQLLKAARVRGCRTLDGSGMAVHKAAAAFEIFTGRKADRARMRQSFLDFRPGVVARAAEG